MTRLDDLGLNEAIELYYEKRDALRRGDLNHLLAMRKKCPDLFDKEKEAQIWDVIEHAMIFQKSARFRELKRELMREKFSVIRNDALEE